MDDKQTAWSHDIDNKWVPARIVGPNVTETQALDYVLRTDRSLIGDGFGNDRAFQGDLEKLIGNPFSGDRDDWRQRMLWQDRFAAALGHVRLQYMGSQWVSSAYVGGPHGVVSPKGEVRFAMNFGKWPHVEDVESDIAAISAAFPWLSFDLWLWDNSSEDVLHATDPTHAWSLNHGTWHRTPTDGACAGRSVPMASSIEVDVMRIAFMPVAARESTWRIPEIVSLFGDKIAAAREAANQSTADVAQG